MINNLVQEIIEVIADDKGVEPAELDVVLANHVNTEVLQQLDNDETGTWIFSFELPERTVTVMSDGTILLDDKSGGNCLAI